MLEEKLSKLGASIHGESQAKQSQKSADWSRVQQECPEQAEHIAAMFAAFGKPERVRVKNAEGELILDSNRYK